MAGMESLNRTIKNTLHFISEIQEICDKKRLFIEKQKFQEHNRYMKDWKQEQRNPIKQSPKKAQGVFVREEKVEALSLAEEMKDLALADSLIEKARRIRSVNKDLNKEAVKNQPVPLAEPSNDVFPSTACKSHSRRTFHKDLEGSNGNGTVFPRSKSALLSSRTKFSIVPRSKSANVRQAFKEVEKVSRSNQINKLKVKHYELTSSSRLNEHMKTDKSDTVILSSKELSEYKNVWTSQNGENAVTRNVESTGNCNGTNISDSSQVSHNYNCFPTLRGFQNELKRISCSKSNFHLHKGGLWYPYLSSKSKSYLFMHRKFNTFDNLTTAFEMLYKIQETMLWIDILSMVGRDTLPNILIMDENDWTIIRLCSYLESMCREDLQKVPVLDPH